MFRRSFILAAVTLLALGGCDAPAKEKPAAKTNFVLVTFDTTRADYLSCYGHPGNLTPNIDRIAREGMRFEYCYTTAPITLPAHATIMTGLYPFQHQLRDNGAGVLDDKAVTLAELFRAQGYRTGGFVGAYVLHSRYGLGQGFDVYSDEFEGRRAHMHGGVEFAERTADAVTNAAITWLSQEDNRPFFIWVHYFDPHAPYEPPGQAPSGDVKTDYAGEIQYTDQQLGRVLEKIEGLSRASNRENFVFITADHGEGLGEHGEDTHGLLAYNSTIRVPLIIKGPGLPGGHVSATPASLIDVFPTITQLAGVSGPYRVPGDDLSTSPQHRSVRPLYFETHMAFHMYGWSPLEGVILGHEKFISSPSPELLDLKEDPGETTNIVGLNPGRVAQREADLGKLKESGDGPQLSAGAPEIDRTSIQKLQSLGYVSVPQQLPSDISALPDPKAMLPIRERLTEAERLLAKGDIQGARLLEDVMESDPANLKALALLTDFVRWPEVRGALIPLALARLQKPLLPPFDVELRAWLGLALCKEGQSEEALRIFSQAQAIQAGTPSLNGTRSECFMHLDRFDDAAEVWKGVLKTDARNTAVIEKLGDVFVRKSDFARAVELYSQAVDLDPENAQVHAKLGGVFQHMGKVESAVQSYQSALRIAPQLVQLRRDLGSALLTLGKAAEAVEEYARVVTELPDRADVHYDLGVALAQCNRNSEAIERFREALRLSPDHGDALVNLGVALLRQGDAAGLEALERASRLEPVAGAAHLNLAIAARREGNTQKWLYHLERAAASRPPSQPAIEELKRLAETSPPADSGLP